MQKLSLRQEADRIEDVARLNIPGAAAELSAILDRVKRLHDDEMVAAMDFNSRLITELRVRGCRLIPLYSWPPFFSNAKP